MATKSIQYVTENYEADLALKAPLASAALTTPTIDGELSSATKQQRLTSLAATLADGGWYDTQALRVKALDIGLTGSRYCPLNRPTDLVVIGGTNPIDPSSSIAGGGLEVGANYAVVPAHLVANMKTDKWALAVRANMLVPASGSVQYIAAVKYDGNKWVSFGQQYANDATKYILLIYDGVGSPAYTLTVSSTVVAAGPADLMMVNDGTNIRCFVDGVEVITEADRTHIPTEAGKFGFQGSAAQAMVASDLAFFYVAP